MQGFIEGKYVRLAEGEDVTASMDIVEAESAESADSAESAGDGVMVHTSHATTDNSQLTTYHHPGTPRSPANNGLRIVDNLTQ